MRAWARTVAVVAAALLLAHACGAEQSEVPAAVEEAAAARVAEAVEEAAAAQVAEAVEEAAAAQVAEAVVESAGDAAFVMAVRGDVEGTVAAAGAELDIANAQAIQLVRPTDEGDRLEVTPEGLAFLDSITAPTHVVGVVGPYHGGKSYLLNQLMGIHGFQTGTDQNPTTKGLWVWSVPATVDGGNFAVLFLDTEGFAASGVTEYYDAKVFAIATLFSSYLIYNDDKTIDQDSIERVETLARRAQLFQLKTAVSEDGVDAELNPARLFPMPPLTWVVEDYMYAWEADGETPTQWLLQLLQGPRKDAGAPGQQSALTSIFPSIDCQTLFFPAAVELLHDVSQVTPDDMTEQFKAGVAQLKTHVASRLLDMVPSRNGPQLAALLRVIVDASNTGKFDHIPSYWNMFTQAQLKQADAASAQCFSIHMAALLKSDPPKPMAHFQASAADAVANCSQLFQSMLVGMDTQYRAQATLNHDTTIQDQRQEVSEAHMHNIHRFCDKAASDCVASFANFSTTFHLPVASSVLGASLASHREVLLSQLDAAISVYGSECSKHGANLATSLQLHHESIAGKNDKLHMAAMQAAAERAREEFRRLVDRSFDELLRDTAFTEREVEELLDGAQADVLAMFDAATEVSRNESSFEDMRNAVVATHARKEVQQRNDKRIVQILQAVAERIGDEVATAFSQVGVPILQATLKQLVEDKQVAAAAQFDKATSKFVRHASVPAAKKALQEDISGSAEDFTHRNTVAHARVFKHAFKHAMNRVREAAKASWSSFLLRRRAAAIAMEEIHSHVEERKAAADGSSASGALASTLDEEMVSLMVEEWLHHEDVRTIIHSADVWQTIGLGIAVTVLVALILLCRCGKARK